MIAVTAEGETHKGNAITVNPRTEEVTLLSLGIVTDIAWNADATQLAIATVSGIMIRDADTLEVLFYAEVDREISRPHLQHQLVTVAWSPDERVIAGGMGDGLIYVWAIDNSQPVITFFGNDYKGDDRFLGWIHDLHFDETGNYLSSISGDGTMRTWDLQQGSLASETVMNPSYASAFSPYGARIALGLPVNADAPSSVPENTNPRIQRFLDGALEVYAVNLTVESVQSLADTCNVPEDIKQALVASQNAARLSDVINMLQELPEDTISPTCAADLTAGITALLNE